MWAFFICPDLSRFISLLGKGELQFIINTSFLGGAYGVYLIIGYLEQKEWLKRVSNGVIVVVGVISFAGVITYQYACYYMGKGYNVWYDNFFLMTCSVCLFEGLKRCLENKSPGKKNRSIMAHISDYSLGIFFLHRLVLTALSQQFEWENMQMPMAVYLMFMISFALSYLFVWMIKKNRWTREYMLGMSGE